MASTRFSARHAPAVLLGTVALVLAIVWGVVGARQHADDSPPEAASTASSSAGEGGGEGGGAHRGSRGQGEEASDAVSGGEEASDEDDGQGADASEEPDDESVQPVSGSEQTGDSTDDPHAASPVPSAVSPWQRVSSSLEVPDAAKALIRDYKRRHDCLLRHAGYLDVFGNVWGCVVEGAGWVDICVVEQDASGEGSVVRTVRLDADAWDL